MTKFLFKNINNLCNINFLRSIENLYKVMDFVMEDCKNL